MTRSSVVPPAVLRRAGVVIIAAGLLATGCQSQSSETAATVSDQSAVRTQAPVLDAPRLSTADNFRDLAGVDTAYAADGGTLRPESVYRSNALEVNDEDLATLEGLGISTVIDLRTPEEIEEHPDRVPDGAEYVNVDILSGGVTGANPNADFAVGTPDEAARTLEDLNHDFVTDEGMRERFGQVLTTIAQAEGPVVFHCTAGKDRAGWTAAVLQLAAGVDEEDVVENYLATNDYSQQRIEATTQQVGDAEGEQAAEAFGVLLGVQESFLQSGLDTMESEYGDVDGYLSEGLELDDETVANLKDKLIAA
ncbi:tyrosine-protein phosphatase [Rothia halotolerans]|uniref:tyrosine-protein phosphatase n=1 Tax=Rothia halotolerans TaxID=405770 RepID=UPI00101D1320|nr:tyrosine-protein phosphatase [Rothia halotolerans]